MAPTQEPTNADHVTGSEAIRISKNHRRRIAASLGLIDDLLARWEAYAAGAEDTGALRHLRNDLTPTQRDALGRLVGRIRDLLAELKRELALATDLRTVRGILPGECGILWETVAGLTPRHLRAWGSTTSEFDDYWEPRRQKLEDLLNQVAQAVSMV